MKVDELLRREPVDETSEALAGDISPLKMFSICFQIW